MAMGMSLERDDWHRILMDTASDYAAKGWWVPVFLASSTNAIELC